ncbi:MATE family efflux transporter [Capnocytophaga sp. oral taxon 338]|uniref:MATE family efflux transporter n=1 Tax=Capnocytophaga sp. oral taxon 338 TaxID=710239 RepID=UPI000202C5E9|nr:MATE family efflux transporter [Capnocytophaga sp. oral taxon 338]EGD34563.1 MATE family multi antimicrobial extrusion protein [Capnocytophaga sp. oral taxon 338 str. F0234]
MINIRQYTKEFSYNLRLATPIILSMLGHTLVGVIDTAMVGNVGTLELAAASLGNSYVFLLMSFGIGFSTVVTTLTAESEKKKNPTETKSILTHGIFINGLLSLIIFGGLFFSEPLMRYTQQKEDVIALAVPYVHLVAFSIIPLMIFQSFKQFADGFSITQYSLYVTIIGNLFNIFLNYLFIYGNWGCPSMGVLGAAIGTLVSRFMMPFMLWIILYKNTRMTQYMTKLIPKINRGMVKKFLNLGVPSGLQVVFEAGIFIAATWISGVLGEVYQAANQIASSIATLTFMIANGMSVVAMIRVGNYKGLEDYISLRRVAISIFLFILLTQIVLGGMIGILRYELPTLFLDTNKLSSLSKITLVIDESAHLLLIAALFQLVDGLQTVALAALRGLQDAKIPMVLSFISYWIIAFPICYYLGLHTSLRTTGIWIGLLSGLAFSAILQTTRFLFLSGKLIKHNHS